MACWFANGGVEYSYERNVQKISNCLLLSWFKFTIIYYNLNKLKLYVILLIYFTFYILYWLSCEVFLCRENSPSNSDCFSIWFVQKELKRSKNSSFNIFKFFSLYVKIYLNRIVYEGVGVDAFCESRVRSKLTLWGAEKELCIESPGNWILVCFITFYYYK